MVSAAGALRLADRAASTSVSGLSALWIRLARSDRAVERRLAVERLLLGMRVKVPVARVAGRPIIWPKVVRGTCPAAAYDSVAGGVDVCDDLLAVGILEGFAHVARAAMAAHRGVFAVSICNMLSRICDFDGRDGTT